MYRSRNSPTSAVNVRRVIRTPPLRQRNESRQIRASDARKHFVRIPAINRLLSRARAVMGLQKCEPAKDRPRGATNALTATVPLKRHPCTAASVRLLIYNRVAKVETHRMRAKLVDRSHWIFIDNTG